MVDVLTEAAAPSAAREKKKFGPTEFQKQCRQMVQGVSESIDLYKNEMKPRALELLEELQDYRAKMAGYEVAHTFHHTSMWCESEIEKLFLLGILGEQDEYSGITLVSPRSYENNPEGFLVNSKEDTGIFGVRDILMPVAKESMTPVAVMPQFPIGKYRADFLLFGISPFSFQHKEPLKVPLVIECDGHAYHEKTKEQAARDKKRDRSLLAAGFQVMRFSGSELWRDPHGCAKEALRHIYHQQFIYDES